MLTTGFLGTRADAFVDIAMVFFAVAPFLMIQALRLAAQRRYRAHRRLQVGVLLGALVAVLLLEGSIRFGHAVDAFTVSAYYGTATLAVLFAVISRLRSRRSSAGVSRRSCLGVAFPAFCRAPSVRGTGSGAGLSSWGCGSPA